MASFQLGTAEDTSKGSTPHKVDGSSILRTFTWALYMYSSSHRSYFLSIFKHHLLVYPLFLASFTWYFKITLSLDMMESKLSVQPRKHISQPEFPTISIPLRHSNYVSTSNCYHYNFSSGLCHSSRATAFNREQNQTLSISPRRSFSYSLKAYVDQLNSHKDSTSFILKNLTLHPLHK